MGYTSQISIDEEDGSVLVPKNNSNKMIVMINENDVLSEDESENS